MREHLVMRMPVMRMPVKRVLAWSLPAFLIAGCMAGDAANEAPDGAVGGAHDASVPVARSGNLVVTRAVAPAPIGDRPAALYFTVVNEGAEVDTLTGVASEVAGEVMLHDNVRRGGSVVMEHVHSIVVPPGDSVRLAPGGLHVMMTGLRAPIAAGDTLRATLHFSRGGSLEIRVPVVTYGEMEGRT